MMKNGILILATYIFICMSAIGKTPAWDSITPKDSFVGKNSIYVGLSLGSHVDNTITGTFSIDYHRRIKGNFYWSAGYSMNYSNDGLRPDQEGVEFYLTNNFINAMAHYRLPLIKDRLFFVRVPE